VFQSYAPVTRHLTVFDKQCSFSPLKLAKAIWRCARRKVERRPPKILNPCKPTTFKAATAEDLWSRRASLPKRPLRSPRPNRFAGPPKGFILFSEPRGPNLDLDGPAAARCSRTASGRLANLPASLGC